MSNRQRRVGITGGLRCIAGGYLCRLPTDPTRYFRIPNPAHVEGRAPGLVNENVNTIDPTNGALTPAAGSLF